MLLIDALENYLAVNTRIRSQATREHYARSLRQFAEHLGRRPTTDDLTDDNLAGFMLATVTSGLTEQTANQRAKQIRALWTWLAKRRLVDAWPTVANLPTPEPLPEAWTLDEFAKLLQACRETPGWIGPHLASDWWWSLHAFLWDTAERIGAALLLERSMVDAEGRIARAPARIRKGSRQAMVYRLRSSTAAILERMSAAPSPTGLVWDRPFADDQTLYARYRKVVERAGLPWTPRKTGFHKIRRTVLTQIAMRGGNATQFAGHSSPKVTEAYLDRAMIAASESAVWPQEVTAPVPRRRWWHRVVG